MRRRINDDLSYMPAPYRIMKQMLMAPGILSGYSFYKSYTMDTDISGTQFEIGDMISNAYLLRDQHTLVWFTMIHDARSNTN